MARILIVEDDQDMVDLICHVLQSDGHECRYELTGEKVDQVVARDRPDLVILDVNLPGVGGPEVCRRIRQFSQVPVLFLTLHAEVADQVVGFSAGADDYVTKPFAPTVLAMRVNAILRRTTSQPAVQRRVEFRNLEIDLEAQIVTVDGSPVDLSRIEYNLLAALAENRGIIVGKARLLELVWSDWYGSDHVVDVNVSRLRQKLSAAGAPREAISTHRGRGYRFGER